MIVWSHFENIQLCAAPLCFASLWEVDHFQCLGSTGQWLQPPHVVMTSWLPEPLTSANLSRYDPNHLQPSSQMSNFIFTGRNECHPEPSHPSKLEAQSLRCCAFARAWATPEECHRYNGPRGAVRAPRGAIIAPVA